MGGTPGPKSASANMEFKEMKEEVTTPPTVEYEHIKVLIIPFYYLLLFLLFVFLSVPLPYINICLLAMLSFGILLM